MGFEMVFVFVVFFIVIVELRVVMNFDLFVFEGMFICFEFLLFDYVDGFCEVGFDFDIWIWMLSDVDSCEKMEGFVVEVFVV